MEWIALPIKKKFNVYKIQNFDLNHLRSFQVFLILQFKLALYLRPKI